LNIPTGKITYTKAGHPGPVFFNKKDRTLKHLDTDGSLMGFFKDARYEEKQITLKKGDRLILYTDGVNEAADTKDELYGIESIDDRVLANGLLSGKEILEAVMKDLNTFVKDRPFDDDITMVSPRPLSFPWPN
jgi:sigma-B regulation protein RsbU (phosphoserine phosphatase)